MRVAVPGALAAKGETVDEVTGAARAMRGVYTLILLLGVAFLVLAFSSNPPQYRTAVQSIIFLALGVGGLIVSFARR